MCAIAKVLTKCMHDGQSRRVVEIREFYNDFKPPRYVRKLVACLLSSVPEQYLRGLDCVVLTNLAGAPRRDRTGKVTSRKRRVPQSQVFGRYHRAHHGKLPWIELYVDRLAAAASLAVAPFIKSSCFGLVLFHEIGHHIDATIRPEFREKEDVADGWSKTLLRIYIRKRYPFPRPVMRVLGWMLKAISQDLDHATF